MRTTRAITAWLAALAVVLAALLLIRWHSPSGDLPEAAAPGSHSTDPPTRTVRAGAPVAEGATGSLAAAPQPRAEAVPRKFQRRFMFDCSGDRIFVRIGEGESALLPPGSLTGHWIPLAQAGTAWRGRYANEDVVFRPQGDVATFVLGDDTLENCIGTADVGAFAEVTGGVMVQAFGSEPPWTFEITQQDFTLTTNRGARRVEVPFREPIDNGGKVTFRSVLGTQELVATLDRIPCYDAASRETFTHTVAVAFDNAWYYGCGRFIHYR